VVIISPKTVYFNPNTRLFASTIIWLISIPKYGVSFYRASINPFPNAIFVLILSSNPKAFCNICFFNDLPKNISDFDC